MKRQIPSQIFERFRLFDNYAAGLLVAGFDLTTEPLLSGPHILLAALRQGTLINTLSRSGELNDLFISLQRLGLEAGLRHWIDMPIDYSVDESYTFGLGVSLRVARETTGRGAISWTTLLRSILAHDIDIATIIASTGNSSLATSSWTSSSWSMNSHPASSSDVQFSPVRREATSLKRYAKRHLLQMQTLLRELAQRESDQVILVRGIFGSPRQRLHHVLADILIDSNDHTFHGSLGNYKHVFFQDIETFHAAAYASPNGALTNLHYSLRQASALRAILVLTRGQLLSDTKYEEINMQLLGALLQTRGVPVVISYEDEDELASCEPVKLPFINFRVVEMSPYLPDNTRNAIHDYYSEHWKSQSLQVDDDALETVLQLESAIYALPSGILQRKVLPYSAAELLQEAVETVRLEISQEGEGVIKRLALTAKDRIEQLLQDRNEGRMLYTAIELLNDLIQQQTGGQDIVAAASNLHGLWKARWELLRTLPERMQLLADNPVVRKASKTIHVVSQDVVTAQLLSDASYRLRLMRAFEDSVQLAEPRLLNFIEDAYRE